MVSLFVYLFGLICLFVYLFVLFIFVFVCWFGLVWFGLVWFGLVFPYVFITFFLVFVGSVQVRTNMNECGPAMCRWCAGESVCQNEFTGPGKITFAHELPGDVCA